MPNTIPISAVTEAMHTSTQRVEDKPNDQMGKDAFLRLLVAQLKYQNPLSPAEPQEFMAQTAQFTMVEKLEELARDAARSRAVTESLTATGLLGREITWVAPDGTEGRGVVTGTSFGSAGATLHVDDERVPLERVSGVHAPADAPEAPEAPEATEAPDTPEIEDTDPTNHQEA